MLALDLINFATEIYEAALAAGEIERAAGIKALMIQ